MRLITLIVTAIQASIILNVILNSNGLDRIGNSYLLQGLAKAYELELFKAVNLHDEEMQKALTFTAWGLFNWSTMQRYYYFKLPLIQKPPETPLPSPLLEAEWYGEVWLRYPLSDALWPLQIGCTFKAYSKLRPILCDIGMEFFNKSKIGALPIFTKVFAFKSILDDWFTELPSPLAAEKIVFPTQINLQ